MKLNKTLKCLIFSFLCFPFLVSAQKNLSVQFSKDAGKYDNSIRVTLETDLGATIFYTTDGNRPTSKSIRYNSPITIRKTTSIRAIAYKNGKSSKIKTNTYFIDENTEYFLAAITVEPAVLHDPETGWLHKGPNADSIYPYEKANYFSRKEVSADLELFESDGVRVFGDKIGLKLFGGMSRTFEQKSFSIAIRETYGGERRIHHRIFPDKKQNSYKHLVFRNAGSDCEKAHGRDVIITGLLDGRNIEKQSYRPCILYVNGEYWGIYFVRDKVNRHFIEYSTEVDDDSLDLIEHRDRLKAGSIDHYNSMLRYMRNNDLSEKKHYDYIQTQMDVENFMTLQITQIYIDNHDAGGNIKFWRPQTPNGRWRWVLYDTDWGMSLQDEVAYQSNSLEMHTEPNGPGWPNPPWSTFILRNLLKNKAFETDFVNRFADYMNVVFEPTKVISRIDSIQFLLTPEYDRHAQKWGYNKGIWSKHYNLMRTFAQERPDYMYQFLQNKFDIGGANNLNLEVSSGGFVKVNNNIEIYNELNGKYFEKIPIQLEVIPNYGFQFSHWELPSGKKTEGIIEYRLSAENNKIKAIFKKSNHQLDGKIIINEIAPNNKKAGDWMELYNDTNEKISLNNWTIRDANNSHLIKYASIPPKDYLVICEDTSAFRNFFPKVTNITGNLPFGISKKKEMLRLFASNGALIDSVYYELGDIDSVFVLSLPQSDLENSDDKNWNLETGYGSPNQNNSGDISNGNNGWIKWLLYGLGLILIIGVGYYFLKSK